MAAKDLPKVLRLQTHVNGVLEQDATTEDLIFSIPFLIKTLSEGQTLQPGDVLATGTVSLISLYDTFCLTGSMFIKSTYHMDGREIGSPKLPTGNGNSALQRHSAPSYQLFHLSTIFLQLPMLTSHISPQA